MSIELLGALDTHAYVEKYIMWLRYTVLTIYSACNLLRGEL
jgi:hypothetical protein